MLIEAYLLIYIQFQFVLDELRRFFLRRYIVDLLCFRLALSGINLNCL